MTLLQLEYFKIMSQVMHYSKAAELLHTTQPNIHYAIKELEKELGVPLFERRGRRVVLTNFGTQFSYYVEKALNSLIEGRETLQQIKLSPQTLSIAYIDEVGYDFLPDLLRDFHALFPSTKFQLYKYHNAEIPPRLFDQSVDLAFTIEAGDIPTLEQIPILEQDITLFVPPNHRFANRASVSLSEIGDDPMVITNPQTGIRRIIDEMCETAHINLNIIFEAEECNAAAAYVSAGLALSILPSTPLCTQYNARAVRIAYPSRRRYLFLSYSNTHPLSNTAIQFRDFVIKRFSIL